MEFTKNLWEILEVIQNISKDATSKKFLISSLNDYKLVHFRPIMEQCHEIHRIYKHPEIKMDEVLFVSSIIDNLPHSWRDVSKNLKNKEKDIDLNQLGTLLQIKVSIWTKENGGYKNFNTSSIKIVETSPKNQGAKQNIYTAHSSYKGKLAKVTKSNKEGYWICGKLGHQKKDCFIY